VKRYGRGSAWVDIDGDGWDGLFFADTDDRWEPDNYGVSMFFINKHPWICGYRRGRDPLARRRCANAHHQGWRPAYGFGTLRPVVYRGFAGIRIGASSSLLAAFTNVREYVAPTYVSYALPAAADRWRK
jgi:hypothetical protein